MLGSLLLPEDVVIVPVSRLAPGMRDRMEHEDGDHCVTRPRSRTTTTVVDARTAALLERFRTPSTIVDAVVAFCSAEGSDLRASWCNGAAGHVPLWVLAHALLGDDRFEHLARGAAWTAYEDRAGAPGDLCCGYAGRAYALLCLHRHLGEPVWLARARALTDRAAASIEGYAFRRESLYKGRSAWPCWPPR